MAKHVYEKKKISGKNPYNEKLGRKETIFYNPLIVWYNLLLKLVSLLLLVGRFLSRKRFLVAGKKEERVPIKIAH